MGNILTVAVDSFPKTLSEYIDALKEKTHSEKHASDDSEIEDDTSNQGKVKFHCPCSPAIDEGKNIRSINSLVTIWRVSSGAFPYKFNPKSQPHLDSANCYVLLFVYGVCHRCTHSLDYSDLHSLDVSTDPCLSNFLLEAKSKISPPTCSSFPITSLLNDPPASRFGLSYEILVWKGIGATESDKALAVTVASRLNSALITKQQNCINPKTFCNAIWRRQFLDPSSLVFISNGKPAPASSEQESSKTVGINPSLIIHRVLSSWLAQPSQSDPLPINSHARFSKSECAPNRVVERYNHEPLKFNSIVKLDYQSGVLPSPSPITSFIISPRTVASKARVVAALAISPRGVMSRISDRTPNQQSGFTSKHSPPVVTMRQEKESSEIADMASDQNPISVPGKNPHHSPSSESPWMSPHEVPRLAVGCLGHLRQREPPDRGFLSPSKKVRYSNSGNNSSSSSALYHPVISPPCLSHESGDCNNVSNTCNCTRLCPPHLSNGSKESVPPETPTGNSSDSILPPPFIFLPSTSTSDVPARPPSRVPGLRLSAIQPLQQNSVNSGRRSDSHNNYGGDSYRGAVYCDSYRSVSSTARDVSIPSPSHLSSASKKDSDANNRSTPSSRTTTSEAASVSSHSAHPRDTFSFRLGAKTLAQGLRFTLKPTDHSFPHARIPALTRLRLGGLPQSSQQPLSSRADSMPGSTSGKSDRYQSVDPPSIEKSDSRPIDTSVIKDTTEVVQSRIDDRIPSDRVIEKYCAEWSAIEEKPGIDDEEDLSKETLLERYRSVCSEVIPDGRLYISGFGVAQNYSLLKEVGITHIVNVAGDTCGNVMPDDFRYLTFVLHDNRNASEEFQAILYYALEYIYQVLLDPSNQVLVHCREGVSRSATLVVGYLMWRGRVSFSDGLKILRQSRPMCNPNTGFTFLLLRFQKALNNRRNTHSDESIKSIDYHRIHVTQPHTSDPDFPDNPRQPVNTCFSSSPTTPEFDFKNSPSNETVKERKLLRLCGHHESAPFIVALGISLYEPTQRQWMPSLKKGLDPRFFYVLRNNLKIFFWRGSASVHRELAELFFVSDYLRQLREFEVPANDEFSVSYIIEGEEPAEFWECLCTEAPKQNMLPIVRNEELNFSFDMLQSKEVYNLAEYSRRLQSGLLNTFNVVPLSKSSAEILSLSLAVNNTDTTSSTGGLFEHRRRRSSVVLPSSIPADCDEFPYADYNYAPTGKLLYGSTTRGRSFVLPLSHEQVPNIPSQLLVSPSVDDQLQHGVCSITSIPSFTTTSSSDSMCSTLPTPFTSSVPASLLSNTIDSISIVDNNANHDNSRYHHTRNIPPLSLETRLTSSVRDNMPSSRRLGTVGSRSGRSSIEEIQRPGPTFSLNLQAAGLNRGQKLLLSPFNPSSPKECHLEMSGLPSSRLSTERGSMTVLRTDIRSVKVREGSVDLEPDVPYLYTWPSFSIPLDVFDSEDFLSHGFYIIAQYGPKPLLDMLGRLQQQRSPRSIKSLKSLKSMVSVKSTDEEYTSNAESLRSHYNKDGYNSGNDSPDDNSRLPSVIFKEVQPTEENPIKTTDIESAIRSPMLLTLLPVTDPLQSSDGITRAIEITGGSCMTSLTFRPNGNTSRQHQPSSLSRRWSTGWMQHNELCDMDPNPPVSDDEWVSPVDEVEIQAEVTPTVLWVWRGSEWISSQDHSDGLTDEELLEQFKMSHGILPDDKDVIVHWEDEENESDGFQQLIIF